MTRIAVIAKAQPFGNEETEGAEIHITEQMPRSEMTLEELANWFDIQAYWLEKRLFESLPGGTYDHLLSKMLERKASHFKVSYKE